MSKIKVEKLGCYKEVVRVIGVEKAKCELMKVVNNYPTGTYFNESEQLSEAFAWIHTEQGFDFWSYISSGENPYG